MSSRIWRTIRRRGFAMLAPVNGCELMAAHLFRSVDGMRRQPMSVTRRPMPLARAEVKFNIRFTTEHSADGPIGCLEEHFERVGGDQPLPGKPMRIRSLPTRAP